MNQSTELRVTYTWDESVPPISPQVWDTLREKHVTQEPVKIEGHKGRYHIVTCTMGLGSLSFTAIKEAASPAKV